MEAGTRSFEGHEIDISSVDRVLFDGAGLTKGDLLDHYDAVADVALPYLRGRAAALKRCPSGIGDCFFQKSAQDHFPDWIRRVAVPLRGEDRDTVHVVVDDRATLVYLADQGTVELHTWLSCADALEHPDQAIFDLDPPSAEHVDEARAAARAVRAVLDELGLPSFLKTSGSKGYHVHVRLDASATFDEVRDLTRRIARVVAARHPDSLTVEQRKRERHGRVFLDYLRNGYGQHAVAPYSVRALPGAPVATPIDWDELGRAEPQRYTIENLPRRLAQKEDPWAAAWDAPGSLADAAEQLPEMEAELGA